MYTRQVRRSVCSSMPRTTGSCEFCQPQRFFDAMPMLLWDLKRLWGSYLWAFCSLLELRAGRQKYSCKTALGITAALLQASQILHLLADFQTEAGKSAVRMTHRGRYTWLRSTCGRGSRMVWRWCISTCIPFLQHLANPVTPGRASVSFGTVNRNSWDT